jgi:hypothetical protein
MVIACMIMIANYFVAEVEMIEIETSDAVKLRKCKGNAEKGF